MLSKVYSFFSTHISRLIILMTIYYFTSKYTNINIIYWLYILVGCVILIYTIILILFLWIINPIRDFKRFLKEEKEKQINKENEKNI